MESKPIERTINLITRGAKNYPTVCMEIAKELTDQSVKVYKANLSLLRLSAKAAGILTFPLWIVPLALAFFVVSRLPVIHPVPPTKQPKLLSK